MPDTVLDIEDNNSEQKKDKVSALTEHTFYLEGYKQMIINRYVIYIIATGIYI